MRQLGLRLGFHSAALVPILVQFLTPVLGPKCDPRFGAAPSSHNTGWGPKCGPIFEPRLDSFCDPGATFFGAAAQALNPPLQPPREAILRQLARQIFAQAGKPSKRQPVCSLHAKAVLQSFTADSARSSAAVASESSLDSTRCSKCAAPSPQQADFTSAGKPH